MPLSINDHTGESRPAPTMGGEPHESVLSPKHLGMVGQFLADRPGLANGIIDAADSLGRAMGWGPYADEEKPGKSIEHEPVDRGERSAQHLAQGVARDAGSQYVPQEQQPTMQEPAPRPPRPRQVVPETTHTQYHLADPVTGRMGVYRVPGI